MNFIQSTIVRGPSVPQIFGVPYVPMPKRFDGRNVLTIGMGTYGTPKIWGTLGPTPLDREWWRDHLETRYSPTSVSKTQNQYASTQCRALLLCQVSSHSDNDFILSC